MLFKEILYVTSFRYQTGEGDPSLNLCDFYLFGGSLGKTVMAMTVIRIWDYRLRIRFIQKGSTRSGST